MRYEQRTKRNKGPPSRILFVFVRCSYRTRDGIDVIVVITIALDVALLESGYDERLVDVIRSIPGRQWDAEARVWRFPPQYANGLVQRLRQLGHVVDVDDLRPKPKVPEPSNPFTALLNLLPPDRRADAIRQLRKITHPDAGGSHELSLMLNAAVEAAKESA
jgi:hypothetical protein